MNWFKVEYQVPPKAWIKEKIKLEREIRDWCFENFPAGNWQVFQNRAVFANEQDALIFALRWA